MSLAVIPAALAMLVWFPAILGFGAWWRSDNGPLGRLAVAGMIGLATMSALAVAIHVIVPISPEIAAAALVLGWVAFAVFARRLLSGIRLEHVAVVTLIALVLAAITQLPARHYDAGLYQLQSVKWIREYAQIRGIASLHRRFGFNSSWFALAALVETPWLVGRSVFFLNAFPVLFALLASAEALERFRAGDRTGSNAYFLLASFAAFHGMDVLGPLSTDSPTIIAAVFSFGFMLRAFEEDREFASASSIGLFLSAFAVTVKISAAVLAAGWVVIAAVKRRALAPRQRILALAGVCALILPWTAHGLLASGCALFPVVASCFPELPWATPLSVTAAENESIRSWARWPGIPPGLAPRGWGWLPQWGRSLVKSPHTCIPLAPRFGFAFLLPIAILPLAIGTATRWRALRASARTVSIMAAIAAAISFTWWSVRPLRKLRPATYAFVSWPALPSPAVERKVTVPGTGVWVPVTGDQCWDAPLPCTPHYNASFEWSGDVMLIRAASARGSSIRPRW